MDNKNSYSSLMSTTNHIDNQHTGVFSYAKDNQDSKRPGSFCEGPVRVPPQISSQTLLRNSSESIGDFPGRRKLQKLCKNSQYSVYTARDWHRSFLIGTFRAEHGARQQSYTPEQKAEVLRLRKEEGKSYNVISQLTKVNRATVLQWIHKDIAQQQAAEAAAQQAPANDSEMTETGPTA